MVLGASAASHNIGKLVSLTAGAHMDAYTYDNLARLSNRTITITSDASYAYEDAYDPQSGLLSTLTYPTSTSSYRLKLQYTYPNGILQKIADFNAPATVFWTNNSTNARGEITAETLGNGVVVGRSWDDVTGRINSAAAGVGGGTVLQNRSYLFDEVGQPDPAPGQQPGPHRELSVR